MKNISPAEHFTATVTKNISPAPVTKMLSLNNPEEGGSVQSAARNILEVFHTEISTDGITGDR